MPQVIYTQKVRDTEKLLEVKSFYSKRFKTKTHFHVKTLVTHADFERVLPVEN